MEQFIFFLVIETLDIQKIYIFYLLFVMLTLHCNKYVIYPLDIKLKNK